MYWNRMDKTGSILSVYFSVCVFIEIPTCWYKVRSFTIVPPIAESYIDRHVFAFTPVRYIIKLIGIIIGTYECWAYGKSILIRAAGIIKRFHEHGTHGCVYVCVSADYEPNVLVHKCPCTEIAKYKSVRNLFAHRSNGIQNNQIITTTTTYRNSNENL